MVPHDAHRDNGIPNQTQGCHWTRRIASGNLPICLLVQPPSTLAPAVRTPGWMFLCGSYHFHVHATSVLWNVRYIVYFIPDQPTPGRAVWQARVPTIVVCVVVVLIWSVRAATQDWGVNADGHGLFNFVSLVLCIGAFLFLAWPLLIPGADLGCPSNPSSHKRVDAYRRPICIDVRGRDSSTFIP